MVQNLKFLPYTVGFLLLEESLQSVKRRERKDSDSNHERTSNKTGAALETEDSASSLQSGDSGIELSSGVKMNNESDANKQPEMDDDELTMMESDIDTDSNFDTIDPDTELLMKEHRDLDGSKINSHLSRYSKSSITSCLLRECGSRQCCGRVRNSLMDSYGCVVLCVERLKGCGNCHHSKQWRLGEVRGQAKVKLRKTRQSILTFIRLILDRRVFLSTLLYALLAFFTIMCNEVNQCNY